MTPEIDLAEIGVKVEKLSILTCNPFSEDYHSDIETQSHVYASQLRLSLASSQLKRDLSAIASGG